MKTISSLIAALMVIVLPTTFSHAETLSLNGAIQQLNFTLNVKWDQKDPKVKNQALATFVGQIDQLKAQGMSQEQIVAGLKAQLNDEKLAADLDQLAAIAKEKKMDDAQTVAYVMDYATKAQKQGASWNSTGTIIVGVSVALVIVLMVVLLSSGGSGTAVVAVGCTNYCGYDVYGNYYCTCY